MSDEYVPVDLSELCVGWEEDKGSFEKKTVYWDPNPNSHAYVYAMAHPDLGTIVYTEQLGVVSGIVGTTFSCCEGLPDLDPTDLSVAVDRAKRSLRIKEDLSINFPTEEQIPTLEDYLLDNGFIEQDSLILVDRVEEGHFETDRYFLRTRGDQSLLLIVDQLHRENGYVKVSSRLFSGDELAPERCYFMMEQLIAVTPGSFDTPIAKEFGNQITFIDREFSTPTVEYLDLSEILPEDWSRGMMEINGEDVPVYFHPESEPQFPTYLLAVRDLDGDIIVYSLNLAANIEEGTLFEISQHQEHLTYSNHSLSEAVLSHASKLQVRKIQDAEMVPTFNDLDEYLSDNGFERIDNSAKAKAIKSRFSPSIATLPEEEVPGFVLGDREGLIETDVYFYRNRGDQVDVVVLGYDSVNNGSLEVQTGILQQSADRDLIYVAKFSELIFADYFLDMVIIPTIRNQLDFMGREYMSSAILAPSSTSQDAALLGLSNMWVPSNPINE